MRRLLAISILFAFVAALAAGSRGEAEASSVAGTYHPTTVLVGFADLAKADARAAAHDEVGGTVVNRFDWLNLDVVRVPDGASPPDVAAGYERLAGVAYAHPNWVATLDGTESIPNDALFGQLYGMHNTGQGGGKPDADIDAPEGWDIAYGPGNFPSTGGTRVGMLDSGIDQAHADLLNKTKACATAISGTGVITEGTCTDDNSHGTHTSGTVAAIANNTVGVAGAAPNAELAVFKGFNASGTGFIADLIVGLHWLHTTGNAIVLSNSWGGPGSAGLQAEVQDAHNDGAILIAAAGNDGNGSINFPAGYAEVISVAALDRNDNRASFSNFNADVELSAAGVDVFSSVPGNAYAPLSGTSMATPHVSGVAALVMSEKGTNNVQTRAILTSTADDLGAQGRDPQTGFGRVNLAQALTGQQAGGIAGKVTRRGGGGGPISGAGVNCPGAGSATTGSNGRYSISNVSPGNYSCTASATGFRSKTKPVTVQAGRTATLNFKLRRS